MILFLHSIVMLNRVMFIEIVIMLILIPFCSGKSQYLRITIILFSFSIEILDFESFMDKFRWMHLHQFLVQPPRMFGMPPPPSLPNQMTAMSPVVAQTRSSMTVGVVDG